MATFQPPPTYAEVVLYDKDAQDPEQVIRSARFNPIWLKWFVDVAASLGIAGTGSVSSVALSLPSEFSVGGSPITTTGTLAASWVAETHNFVFAGPAVSGSATPAFRQLVGADMGAAAAVATTDATTTTLATIAIPSATTVLIYAVVRARRTGGTGGVAEDGAGYILAATYKNVAGTATEIGETAIVTHEDQAGWNATFTPSGSNALLQVTGAVNNNVDWAVNYLTYTVA